MKNVTSKRTKKFALLLAAVMLLTLLPVGIAATAESADLLGYDVTYAPGGEDVSDMPPGDSGVYGGVITVPAGPTRDGYDFTGWLAEADSTTLTLRVGPYVYDVPDDVQALGPEAAEAFLASHNDFTAYLFKVDSLPITASYQMKQLQHVNAQPDSISGKADGTGLFTFYNVPYGDYLVYVSKPGTLVFYMGFSVTPGMTQIKTSGISWTFITKSPESPFTGRYYDENATSNDGTLWMINGDVIGDWSILPDDQSGIVSRAESNCTFAGYWINKSDRYLSICDLNADGKIDESDTAIVRLFMGATYNAYHDTYKAYFDSGSIVNPLWFFMPHMVAALTEHNNYEIGRTYQPGDTFMLPGNATLTAQWERNRYTVSYDSVNGTEVIDPNNPYKKGDTVTVLGAPTRDGYAFLGWKYGETTYQPGDTFTMPKDDVTLTAQWKANEIIIPPSPETYTVTYAPGAHGTFGSQSTGGLALNAPTPSAPAVTGEEGWTFTGWSPAPAATVTGNATYVAQWEEDEAAVTPSETFTVSYEPGAHGAFPAQVTGGLALDDPTPSAPATPGESGWEFTGWSPAPAATVTGNATYVAQWKEDERTLVIVNPTPPIVPEYIPGGSDFTTPPVPMAPGNALTEDGDGWLELDDDGTPLGKWEWNGDEWVFDDYATPLANMPNTGIQSNTVFYIVMIVMLLSCSIRLFTLITQRKQKVSK